MKTSLFTLLLLLLKSFTTADNNNAIAPVGIASDEIICRYCVFPVFKTNGINFHINYKKICDSDAYIIQKKSAYNCGVYMLDMNRIISYKGAYNKTRKECYSIETSVFSITTNKKKSCKYDKIFFFKDSNKYCKNNYQICCNGNYCNDYDKISIVSTVFYGPEGKVLNYNQSCHIADPDVYYNTLVIGFNHQNIYIKTKTENTIASNNIPIIKIATDEIICYYCKSPIWPSKVGSLTENYQYNKHNKYCDKKAFVVKKKDEYRCALQLDRHYYASVLKICKFLQYTMFSLIAVKKNVCNKNTNIFFSFKRQQTCQPEENTICCDGDFCNTFDNINQHKLLYSNEENKFLNLTINKTCNFIKLIDFDFENQENMIMLNFTNQNVNSSDYIIIKKNPITDNKNAGNLIVVSSSITILLLFIYLAVESAIF